MSHTSDKKSNSSSNDSRYETAVHEWVSEPKQIYKGSLLYQNLHGQGTYFLDNKEKIFYNGFFYLNKLEGYCQVFYHKNGSNFQGLFREHRRFGPGVLTYPDQSQDVGLWDGFSMIRVAKICSDIPPLSTTNEGQIKLLRYRNLVDLRPKEVPDIAVELLKNIGANSAVLSKAHEMYSKNVKNKNSLFFNKKMYDKYYPDKVTTIDIVIEDTASPSSDTEHAHKIKILDDKINMLEAHLDETNNTLTKIRKDLASVSEKLEICVKCCTEPEVQAPEEVKYEPKKSIEKQDSNIKEHIYNVLYYDNLVNASFPSLPSIESDSKLTTPVASQQGPIADVENIQDIYENQECYCYEEMGLEDLVELENKYEKLKRDELFYDQIYKHLQLELDKINEMKKSKQDIPTQKIIVNEILAWNNEPLIVEMLKCSFLNRNTEHMVNFRVPATLSGYRLDFGPPGEQESNCYEFFNACHTGTPPDVIRYLRHHKVNVNVTDAKGNSGMFFAVINSKLDIIRVLVQFGGNINQLNDDGLTPLSLAVLNYLAIKYNVSNWETAFIPDTIVSLEDRQALKHWMPSKSFLSITNLKNSTSSYASSIKKVKSPQATEKKSSCLFSIKCPSVPSIHKHKPEETREVLNTFNQVENCIKVLFDNGAKANYGESPFPTFIMTLYTENFNIVKLFLENGANVHVVTVDENLNAMHILACSRCIEEHICITTLLLRYNCNPNVRTSTLHWPEEKMKLLDNAPYKDKIEDLGKNALHILCIRTDFASQNNHFFEKMAGLLLHRIDVKATYLGLDALRLAIISRNLSLAAYLLRTGLFDPYKCDPYEGNIFTMPFSDRFDKLLPTSYYKELIEFLSNNNVSPLKPFDSYDNTLDYFNKELKSVISKAKIKIIKDSQDLLTNIMYQKIRQNVEMGITQLLYDFAEDQKMESECLKPLFPFLVPDQFLSHLKLLFNYDKIAAERFNKSLVLDIIKYLSRHHHRRSTVDYNTGIPTEDMYIEMIDNMEFRKSFTIKKHTLYPPGLDDQSQYSVCFECLRKLTDKYVECPTCRFLKFCSTECFMENIRNKSRPHPCGPFLTSNSSYPFEESSLLEEWEVVKESCCKRLKALREEDAIKDEVEDGKKKGGWKQPKAALRTSSITFKTVSSKESNKPLAKLNEKLKRISIADKDIISIQEREIGSIPMSSKSITYDIPEKKISDEKINISLTKKAEKTVQGSTNTISKRRDQGSCLQCKMKVSDILSRYPETIISSHFEPLPNLKEPYLIRKTRKVPSKPHFFLEILSKMFPDIHLSELLLPYTCYSDGGHLYYEFKNTNLFCRNYSIT